MREATIDRIFDVVGAVFAIVALYQFTLFGYETGQYRICNEAKYKQIKLESCNEKGGE